MDMVHFQTVQFGKKEEIHDLRQSHANVRVSSSVQGTSWRKGKKRVSKGDRERCRESALIRCRSPECWERHTGLTNWSMPFDTLFSQVPTTAFAFESPTHL